MQGQMQPQILNTTINQPISNQQMVNLQPTTQIINQQQIPNHAPKMQMNQIITNSQTNDVNQQMIDPNSNLNNNMNQMTMINQVPNNQIITQNQPQQINQIPNQQQHLQAGQQMQRIPLQQNRMIITNQQQQPLRPGQQNFHVNRIRPNVNIQNNNSQQPIQQNINQQPPPPQFQQVNVSMQNTNNVNQFHNQMPMSNPIQMAPSPGNNYAPSPQPNIMGSPMNVNMINNNVAQQRIGGPHSNPSPTLNTPVMSANSNSPNMRQATNDDQLYKDKLRSLSKYIEPLRRILVKDNSDKVKSLLDIISDPNKLCRYEILLKCEEVLEKMNLFGKTNQQLQQQQSNLLNTGAKDFNICANLMEAIQSNFKKPSFNHTLQRTIGPAVAAITNNSYEYSYRKNNQSSLDNSSLNEEDNDIPHIIQGEIARLDDKFYIELDPLQHPKSKTIHLICKIDDIDLPCVPPILIKVPIDYPNLAPKCFINKQDYSSSKFFQNTYKIFNNNLELLSNLYSITTLLDKWELSIREALDC